MTRSCQDGWAFQQYKPKLEWIKESELIRIYGDCYRICLEDNSGMLIKYDKHNKPIRVIVINNQ